MPRCFQLIRDETGQPEMFPRIDDEICAMFGEKPDETAYFRGWYDMIGIRVSVGMTLREVRNEWAALNDPEWSGYYADLVSIVNYLSCHYTTTAWWEGK